MYIILQGMAREFVPKTRHEFNIDYDMLASTTANLNTTCNKDYKEYREYKEYKDKAPPTRSSFSTLLEVPTNPETPRIELVRNSLLNLESQTTRSQRRSSVTFQLQPVAEEPEKEKSGPIIRLPKKALTSMGGKSPRSAANTPQHRDDSPSSRHSSNSSQSPKAGKWQNTPDSFKPRELDWQTVTAREESTPKKRKSSLLARARIINTGNTTTLVEDEYSHWTAERGVDDEIREEFRKLGHTYYLGRVLRVKYKRMLEPGSVCGDSALEGQSTRTSAVIAAGECCCLTLHKDDYMKVIRQRFQAQKHKIEFFKQLLDYNGNEEHISTFSLFWEVLFLRKRDQIFRQADPANHLFLVWEGEVTVYFLNQNLFD